MTNFLTFSPIRKIVLLYIVYSILFFIFLYSDLQEFIRQRRKYQNGKAKERDIVPFRLLSSALVASNDTEASSLVFENTIVNFTPEEIAVTFGIEFRNNSVEKDRVDNIE
ncbi:hypothetical protein WN51_01659 [Melipona quadrifasciata]|uniref:Uncharacterized protein n=1 Tax=Melipona quadrifasciata TaxID=166423 RepID=A0A0M8ZWC2_9HYME|nr:hypothetical protein WN51_01659 [Melipona quadrifasciata]